MGTSKYCVTLAFDAGTDLSALEREVDRVAKEKWPNGLPKGYRSPFVDGDEKEQEEFQGKTLLNLKSNSRPQVIDTSGKQIEEDDPEGIYAGCYGRASVSVFAYDVSGSKGVSIWMNNFQKLSDGDRISSRQSAESEFDDELSEYDNETTDLLS